MRGRRVAFTFLVAILSLFFGAVFIGITALTVGMWLADPGYDETNPVLDLGFFALGTVLAGTGFITQLRAPERHTAGLQQAVLGLLALTVAGLIGDRIEPLWGGLIFLLAALAAVALHPARGKLFERGARLSVPLAVLSLVATIPALVYAADMLAVARQAGPSCFMGQCARGDRFAEIAALAIALVVVALLASARPAAGGFRRGVPALRRRSSGSRQ